MKKETGQKCTPSISTEDDFELFCRECSEKTIL